MDPTDPKWKEIEEAFIEVLKRGASLHSDREAHIAEPKGDSNTLHKDKGAYFKASSISELEKYCHSAVVISWPDFSENGSGIVVSYKDKKYLVTAGHVAYPPFNLLRKVPKSLVVHQRTSNGITQTHLKTLPLVYDKWTSLEMGLPGVDLIIFAYEGEVPGVALAESYEEDQEVFCVGYPERFEDTWKDSLDPLVSFGKVATRKEPIIKEVIDWQTKEPYSIRKGDLLFSGVVLAGNSGGGLLNLEGKLIGIGESIETSGILADTGLGCFGRVYERITKLD